MKIYTDIIQGTPEWHAVRCGKVTASRFSDVLAKGEGKTRLSYMKQLRAENEKLKKFTECMAKHYEDGDLISHLEIAELAKQVLKGE